MPNLALEGEYSHPPPHPSFELYPRPHSLDLLRLLDVSAPRLPIFLRYFDHLDTLELNHALENPVSLSTLKAPWLSVDTLRMEECRFEIYPVAQAIIVPGSPTTISIHVSIIYEDASIAAINDFVEVVGTNMERFSITMGWIHDGKFSASVNHVDTHQRLTLL